jgi:hypothetical protein
MLTGFILFAFFLAALFVLAWVVVEIGKRYIARENQYEDDYRFIQNLIFTWEQSAIHYHVIKMPIGYLEKLPHKNPEKTEVLKGEFYGKYTKIRCDIYLKETA